MTPIIGGLIETALKLIDKVLPDPAQKAQAQLELLKLQQAGEFKALEADLQLALAQADINKTDAASSDPFQRRWRPAAGWVCVAGFGYMALLQPLLPWLVAVLGLDAPPLPKIDIDVMMVLLGNLLGFGGFRTYERVKGKA